MSIFLDYHATTPCDPAVVEVMQGFFSAPPTGRLAEKIIDSAKGDISALIGANKEDIILTSGATEANNLAILGSAGLSEGRNEILISAIEHDSVVNPARHLAAQGFVLKTIPVTREGFVDPATVAGMVNEKTFLVSVMAANHEIGTIQPIGKVAPIVQSAGALFHCDATQAVGRIPAGVQGIDLLSFSAHKIYGPQGIGALYIRPSVRLTALDFGGGQQRGLRPGTIPVALAAGFGMACRLVQENLDKDAKHLSALTQLLLGGLPHVILNGAISPRLPGSLNFRIPGIRAEDVLLDLLPDIVMATGAACGSSRGGPSPVLKAIGLSDIDADSSLRLSLGRQSTREDVLFAVERLSVFFERQSRSALK